MTKQEDIINFWFQGTEEDKGLSPEHDYARRWFAQDEAVAAVLRQRFKDDIDKAAQGGYDRWKDSVLGRLALVILLDEFPRRIYQGKIEAFSYDLKALEYGLKAIKLKMDEELPLYQRMFFYFPLMHSENRELQEMSLMYLRRMSKEAADEEDKSAAFYQKVLDYAQKHYDIIKKFGRFPHRNGVFGRRPTSEERAFASGPEAVF